MSMFTSQYLQPEHQQPSFDVKTSPLALLAQTCNSIGKDVAPFNRTLSNSTSSSPTNAPAFNFLGPSSSSSSSEINRTSEATRDSAPQTPNQRRSPLEDVTSSISKSRDSAKIQKNGDFFAKRFVSVAEKHGGEECIVDVVGIPGVKGRSSTEQDVAEESMNKPSEPHSLASKQSVKSSSKSKVSQSHSLRTSSSSSLNSSTKRSHAKISEGGSKRNENRTSLKEPFQDQHNIHNKMLDSWSFCSSIPNKPFMTGLEAAYPGGYLNFFPTDYATLLKHYYLSQIAQQSAPIPNLFDYYSANFSGHLGKLCASSSSSSSSSQHPPFSFNNSQTLSGSKSPGRSLKTPNASDLFPLKHNKIQPSLSNSTGMMSPLIMPTSLASPLLSTTAKDLQNLSYCQLLSQQGIFFPSLPAFQCPFSVKPLNESCSKHFGSFEEMSDHVKIHWNDGSDLPPPTESLHSFAGFPFMFPPMAWSNKSFGDFMAQPNKLSPPANAPAFSGRFHPYSKSYLANHVP